MKVHEVIAALQKFPPDTDVVCLVDYEELMFTNEGELTGIEDIWEPVSDVELYNENGNVVRIR